MRTTSTIIGIQTRNGCSTIIRLWATVRDQEVLVNTWWHWQRVNESYQQCKMCENFWNHGWSVMNGWRKAAWLERRKNQQSATKRDDDTNNIARRLASSERALVTRLFFLQIHFPIRLESHNLDISRGSNLGRWQSTIGAVPNHQSVHTVGSFDTKIPVCSL